jgi:hypothetical protein
MTLGNPLIVGRILPRLFGALAVSSIFLAATVVTANALQLACRLPSATDATKVVATIKISVAEGGEVSVWKGRSNRNDERKKVVLGHWMSTASEGGKFLVVVTESRVVDQAHNIDQAYPPHVYYVDWENAKLVEATFVPYTPSPVAETNARWECDRLDSLLR